MIRFAAPGFLLAGALLALVPLALHMLARTPPERRPLPTARFLTPDRRTRLRLRSPSDLLLLALRMALILLLGAAFARPVWTPDRTGSGTIVVLDTGASMAEGWTEALDAAAARIGPTGALVVFDTAAHVLPDAAAGLDSLAGAGPGAAASTYIAALRGLRTAAGTMAAESASAVLITRPAWRGWSPALPVVRTAAWPARLEIVAVGEEVGQPGGADASVESPAEAPVRTPEAGSRPGSGAPPTASLSAPPEHPLRPYVEAALAALEFGEADTEAGADVLVLVPGSDPPTTTAPHVVALGGDPAGVGPVTPWVGDEGPARPVGDLVLPGGRVLPGWRRLPGHPAPEARVLAVWEGGRPAAVAVEREGSCVAYLAAEPGEGAAADPAFPHLVQALTRPCRRGTTTTSAGTEEGGPRAAAPLDAGALAVLAGDSLPPGARLEDLAGRTGRPLTRFLVVLALLVAGVETALAYRGRSEA